MAKAHYSNEIDAALRAMSNAFDELKKKPWSTVRPADIAKYKRTLAQFDAAVANAKRHLTTYEQGWSKTKGKINPFLASGRKKFKDTVELSAGADNKLKDLLKIVEEIVAARS